MTLNRFHCTIDWTYQGRSGRGTLVVVGVDRQSVIASVKGRYRGVTRVSAVQLPPLTQGIVAEAVARTNAD